jgi:hypothetical protein
MKIKLPVTWQVCGWIEVEADSLEEAIDNFNPNEHELPKNDEASYVDGSFELTDSDPDNIKAMTP